MSRVPGLTYLATRNTLLASFRHAPKHLGLAHIQGRCHNQIAIPKASARRDQLWESIREKGAPMTISLRIKCPKTSAIRQELLPNRKKPGTPSLVVFDRFWANPKDIERILIRMSQRKPLNFNLTGMVSSKIGDVHCTMGPNQVEELRQELIQELSAIPTSMMYGQELKNNTYEDVVDIMKGRWIDKIMKVEDRKQLLAAASEVTTKVTPDIEAGSFSGKMTALQWRHESLIKGLASGRWTRFHFNKKENDAISEEGTGF